MQWILRKLGFTVTYVSEWGEKADRYDALCFAMSKPIHKDMGVAPPWAKMKISR